MLRALMLNNGIRAGEEAHCYVVHAMWSGGSTESPFDHYVMTVFN